jgi:hypothetical protein
VPVSTHRTYQVAKHILPRKALSQTALDSCMM